MKRTTMMRLSPTRLAFILLTTALPASAQTPKVFWQSAPVQPNDTVMVAGEDMQGVTAVRVARLKDKAAGLVQWLDVKPLQLSERCVKFVIPVAWQQGIFAYRLVTGAAPAEQHVVNAPEPWWMQADGGDTATPGGWLRVFGRALNFGGASQARLTGDDGKALVLKAAPSDGYALSFQLPATLRLGTYTAAVHNGFGGDAGWTKAGTLPVKAPAPWPAQVFNVMDFYGDKAEEEIHKTLDKGSPTVDRTEAIQAAFKKAEANGGGVIFFPEGKYAIQGELKVPPRTILRGAGMGLVALRWGKGGFALDGGNDIRRLDSEDNATPGNLITGGTFGLEDLSLYLPREYQTGITTGDAFQMHRVRIRVDRYWIRNGQRENETLLRLGNNCRVTDCDILSQGVALSFNAGHQEVIARNTIMAGKSHLALERSDGAIVEDNDLISLDPTAYINLSGEGRNLYYARNKHTSFFTQQSDFSFTFDGNGGAYFGKVVAVNGTTVTLANDPTYPGWANEKHPLWRRSVVCIMDGRGAGQYRYVTSNQGRTWQVDRPFDVAPDDTSLISIIPFRGRALIIGNRFEDSGWVNMGYGSSFDVTCANNSLYRVGAFLNLGLREPDAIHASWFIQYLNNTVNEGHTLEQTTGDQRKTPLYDGTTTRYAVHRGSHYAADNSGNINIGGNATDAIVEHCTLGNAHSAIEASQDTAGVLLRANTFEDGHGQAGASRYQGGGLEKAVVR